MKGWPPAILRQLYIRAAHAVTAPTDMMMTDVIGGDYLLARRRYNIANSDEPRPPTRSPSTGISMMMLSLETESASRTLMSRDIE